MLDDSLRAGEQYSARRIGGIFRMAESLRLSSEEFDTLCSRYALMRTEIAQLEIAKARATRIGGSTVRIFIPSYPEEGSRIRQEWDSFMTETLGKDRAKAFALEIPGALEARTANFGAASQEYTVTAIKDAAGGSRLFITKFVTTLSQDQPSPDGVRESLSTLDCDISETDGGELSVLRPFTEGLVAVSSEEERRLYHP